MIGFQPIFTDMPDRIPLPRLGDLSSYRLSSHAERQAFYQEKWINPKVKETFGILLDPNRRVSQMYLAPCALTVGIR